MKTLQKGFIIATISSAVAISGLCIVQSAQAANCADTNYHFTWLVGPGMQYTDHRIKDTDSYIYLKDNSGSDQTYYVHAEAFTGNRYVDVSHGQVYAIHRNQTQVIINYVKEDGYSEARLAAQRNTWGLFIADGVWSPDYCS